MLLLSRYQNVKFSVRFAPQERFVLSIAIYFIKKMATEEFSTHFQNRGFFFSFRLRFQKCQILYYEKWKKSVLFVLFVKWMNLIASEVKEISFTVFVSIFHVHCHSLNHIPNWIRTERQIQTEQKVACVASAQTEMAYSNPFVRCNLQLGSVPLVVGNWHCKWIRCVSDCVSMCARTHSNRRNGRRLNRIQNTLVQLIFLIGMKRSRLNLNLVFIEISIKISQISTMNLFLNRLFQIINCL